MWGGSASGLDVLQAWAGGDIRIRFVDLAHGDIAMAVDCDPMELFVF